MIDKNIEILQHKYLAEKLILEWVRSRNTENLKNEFLGIKKLLKTVNVSIQDIHKAILDKYKLNLPFNISFPEVIVEPLGLYIEKIDEGEKKFFDERYKYIIGKMSSLI